MRIVANLSMLLGMFLFWSTFRQLYWPTRLEASECGTPLMALLLPLSAMNTAAGLTIFLRRRATALFRWPVQLSGRLNNLLRWSYLATCGVNAGIIAAMFLGLS